MYYLITHFRVVAAFIIREVATRYGRSPGGYIWALLEPISYISVMTVIRASLAATPPELGESYMLFFATGFLAFSMYKNMQDYLSSSVTANKSLMSYPRVAPFDAITARFVLQAVTSVMVSAAILTAALYTVRHPIPIQWDLVIEATFLAWMMALGIALANIVLFFKYPLYEKMFGVVMRPLFFLSGVFIVPSTLPHPMSDILYMNPITHIVILFREGFYGPRVWDGLDFDFALNTSACSLVLGLLLFTLVPVARQRN